MLTSRAHRVTAIIVGAGFLLLGIVGLVTARGTAVFDPAGALVLGVYAVNPALASLHVLLGAALAMAGLSGARPARVVELGVGLLATALGFLGLTLAGSEANLLALSGAANVVHFSAASVLLAIGLGARRPDLEH